MLLGNDDGAQYKHSISDRFREFARISSVHTRGVIDPVHLKYINSLSLTHSENDLFFVHASPSEPAAYSYVLDEVAASANFNAFKEKICLLSI